MKELMGYELYLNFMFIREGGGLNLILIDENKINLRNKMKELMVNITPDKIDSSGNKFYSKSILYNTVRKAKKEINYKIT
jgi:hypothetical protein